MIARSAFRPGLLVLAAFLSSSPALAQTTTWNVVSGDWGVPGNWTAGVPVTAGTVRINSGTANLTASDGDRTIANLTMGSATGTPAAVLNIANAKLTSTGANNDIGRLGDGTLNITTGGWLAAGSNLRTNAVAGGAGTISVSSGGRLSVGTLLDIGFNSSSRSSALMVDGGIVEAPTGLRIGGVSTGGTFSSEVTLQNQGVITTGAVDVGRNAPAVMNVSSGTVTATGSFRISVLAGGSGSQLNLSGGTINVVSTGNFSIGGAASGSVLQTGGTLDLSASSGGTAYVAGFEASGPSTYTISGGTIRANALSIGNSGTAGATGTFSILDNTADIRIGGSQTGGLSLNSTSVLNAVAGSQVKFVSPTGSLVSSTTSPYFGQNVFMTLAGTETNLSGLGNLKMVFAGGELGELPRGLMEIGGRNVGTDSSGWVNNFHLAGLTIGEGSMIGNLKLVDILDNTGQGGSAALYVDELTVTAGSTLDLNNLPLYYKIGSIAEGAFVVNGTPILVPEPSALMLFAGGLAYFAICRRRYRSCRVASGVGIAGVTDSGADMPACVTGLTIPSGSG